MMSLKKLSTNKNESLNNFRELCLSSSDVFSENLLEIETKETFTNPWHIRVAYDLLDSRLTQDPDTGLIVFNDTEKINRRIVFVFPRNHSKTTVASVNYSLKRIYNNPNIRILIGSATATQAQSFLREIVAHIEHGEILNTVMGNIKSDKPELWRDDAIIVNRTTKKKDPTVAAVGAGGPILSKRADIGIIDDVLTMDNSRTVEGRAKVSFWANNVFSPILEPKTAQRIYVGTLWYKGDYLDERLKDDTYVRLYLRAFIKDTKLNVGSDHPYALDIREIFADDVIDHYGINATEGVLWPERMPKEELELEMSNGTVDFNRQYMNIVISEEDAIFMPEWLEYSKLQGKDYTFMDSYNVSTSPYGPLIIAQGWDLNVSKKTTADWTASVTLGLTQQNEIILLNISRGRYSPRQLRQQFVTLYDLFQPHEIIIENNAFQDFLVQEMNEETILPIKGFTTGGQKFDPYMGINAVAASFENHRIILPYSKSMPIEDRKLVDVLVAEAEQFNQTDHTGDVLMAFWFAYNSLMNQQNRQQPVVVTSTKDFYRSRNRRIGR